MESMSSSSFNDGDGSVAASETTNNSVSTDPQAKEIGQGESEGIAEEETKNVLRLKLLVILVLVASTIGVAVAVYMYVSTAETNSFEENFNDDSDKVLEAIGTALDQTLSSVDSFLVALVSFARYTNSSWPFVTMPDYAVRLAKMQSESKAVLVTQYQYVTGEQRVEWEKYSVENDGWVEEGIEVQRQDKTYQGKIVEDFWTRGDIHDSAEPYNATGPYLPKWQQAPVIPIYAPYNWDAMTFPSLRTSLDVVFEDREIALSDVSNIAYSNDPESERQKNGNNHFIKDFVGEGEDETEPFSDLYFPILDYVADFVTVPEDSSSNLGDVVGVFAMTFYWRDLIRYILPSDSNGIVVVFKNKCGQQFTYQINGPDTLYLGEGDLHETAYNRYEKKSEIVDLDVFASDDRPYTGLPLSGKGCSYTLHVYPSSEMEDDYKSNDPIIFMITSIAIFMFTSLVFVIYDCMVERRQQKVMQSAVKTNAIVSSLFPSNVRDRLFPTDEEANRKTDSNKVRLKSFLSDGKHQHADSKFSERDRSPIADLFPDCTVLFSDIAGFTAWSSIREPSQVFTLLETLYRAFDKSASKRGVFKVETIGDAYVAVAGLPEPCDDHVVVMVKFARDCRHKMMDIVRELDNSLGPGTADLKLRIGLHSGPVTAGVLRGQKSRFQLFGDTVNTASRMESTGRPDKIQVTATTMNLLVEAGRTTWVKPREDLVEAKGKGTMQTYWVEPVKVTLSTTSTSSHFSEGMLNDKMKRLIDWNTDVLARLLKRFYKRSIQEGCPGGVKFAIKEAPTILEEVCDTIDFHESGKSSIDEQDLSPEVYSQLREFIIDIATLHTENEFHNFDHASHVGMTTAKLLAKVEASWELQNNKSTATSSNAAYGLIADPFAQFACVFAALIHDVEHPGVSNARLVDEDSPLVARFQGRSIAEQNAVEISWNLLMQDQYSILRDAICPTEADLKRFRQLVVNMVMATDLFDVDMQRARKNRWDAAFSDSEDESLKEEKKNQRATMILEYIIQASDIAHTMQHWHIFCKWNRKLFHEMRDAYHSGRASHDPAEIWYENELEFFDTLVLPLAKNLRDCGIFGPAGDEFWNYASTNREQWEQQGKQVIKQVLENSIDSSMRTC